MVWREIYYINLSYNTLSTNISDFYDNGKITNIHLKDKWSEYKYVLFRRKIEGDLVIKKYNKYVLNLPKYNYISLIHIVENQKLNDIGNSKYALSQEWYRKHKNDSQITKLKNNVTNFFRNKMTNTHTLNNLWTTFPEFRNLIKEKVIQKDT